jgi:hypothetical protein
MPDYSFLVGKRDSHATFRVEDTDEEIADACDWVPIAWLALFKPDDVVLVEERSGDRPGEGQGVSSEPPSRCATLMAERRSALANLGRRITRLERVLPADLMQRVRALEVAVSRSRSRLLSDTFQTHCPQAITVRNCLLAMSGSPMAGVRLFGPCI